MVKYTKSILPLLLLFFLLFGLLNWSYQYDNKYTAGAPYGGDGVFRITETDLDSPLFLIDGWEFYPDRSYSPADFAAGGIDRPQYTFIGQYSNFSYIEQGHSPFGTATYRMSVEFDGSPRALALEVPELFTDYTLWVNGSPLATTGSETLVDFVADGSVEIILNVENRTHYYSGLYYPPSIGTPSIIARLQSEQLLFYAALCISTLTLVLFSAALWILRERDRLFFHFGMFCLSFVVLCLHPFIRLMGLNGTLWYVLEDGARLAMLMQASRIACLVSGFDNNKVVRFLMKFILPAICLLCMIMVMFVIPSWGYLIDLYGTFIDTLTIASCLWLCICAVKGIRSSVSGSNTILASGCVLGIGFLVNFLNNNQFEPIRTGWQTEYTGFLMVLLFGWLMACRNRDILIKNRLLLDHMEGLVRERTAELYSVLEERKNFFSDMAHNLKAPVAAVHGFISLIREGNLYLDEELKDYLSLIEHENNEMGQRVQALNTVNAFDRVTAPAAPLELNPLLQKVYEDNFPDAGVMGIHLRLLLPDESVKICGQLEKLLTLFENLIYNAISFTPSGGSIQVTYSVNGGFAAIQVSDTGSGIAPEHLPHIFERFYVGREDRSSGSGLGLYIAKLTAVEMGGSIEAESVLGKGAVFTVTLPVVA